MCIYNINNIHCNMELSKIAINTTLNNEYEYNMNFKQEYCKQYGQNISFDKTLIKLRYDKKIIAIFEKIKSDNIKILEIPTELLNYIKIDNFLGKETLWINMQSFMLINKNITNFNDIKKIMMDKKTKKEQYEEYLKKNNILFYT